MAALRQLQQEYDLLSEKLHRLRMAHGIETDAAVIFKLDKQIEAAEREQQRIADQLEGRERLALICPYRGLFAFREQDERLFFGRDASSAALLEAVQARSFLALIGASGSGKSSLVYAGLFPRLRRQESWLITTFRPGDRPFHALAAALIPFLEPDLDEIDRITKSKKLTQTFTAGELSLIDIIRAITAKHPDSRLLLFADQFEELYTLTQNDHDRRRFVDEFLAASDASAFVGLLTLRADFLGKALAYRPLADALQDADIKLGPMNRDELRETIERPAKALEVEIEDGLTDRMLNAVGDEPGSLPLLEFTLTELWNRQTNGVLTHAAYEAVGGVEQALAAYAENIYTSLKEDEQTRTQRIFTRLVRPGEGTEDTRRLATRADVGAANWELVTKLADKRLVVTGGTQEIGKTVEVVHEALIQRWQRLRT